jgi:glycosyltransferase involved in cell wall biosynthesis
LSKSGPAYKRAVHIAYLAPAPYSFVRKDVDGLVKEGVTVHVHYFSAPSPWHLPFALARQFVMLGAWRLLGVRVAVVHFAGYHSLLPVLLGFQTHIIIAGADACAFPSIRYGSFRKPLMRWSMGFSLRHATALLPVHQSLSRFQNTYSDLGPRLQGFAQFVPGLRTPVKPIEYGFDAAQWPGLSNAARSGAICIAMGAAPGNAVHFRKGLDLILLAAEALPAVRFTIVGCIDPAAYQHASRNVTVLGRTTQAELFDLFSSHSLYLQPSVMEGFPNALCEAMLAGCIPIASTMTSMPDIVGDTGAILQNRDARKLVEQIELLLALDQESTSKLRMSARARITPYTMTRRIRALMANIHPWPEDGENTFAA